MLKGIVIKKSNINWKGVFALRNFQKWEIVLKWDLRKSIDEKDFFHLTDKWKKYISEIWWKYFLMQLPEKYVNYSCNPNTNVIDFCDIAIRNIKRGEEITSDYLGLWPWSITKCNCWSGNCKWMVSI